MSLAADYIPVSLDKLQVGTQYGPVEFAIRADSHEKTLALLAKSSATAADPGHDDLLMPSEMWGHARVLCETYGRLNELALTKARWQIHGCAAPGQALVARTELTAKQVRRGLPFATFRTITTDAVGAPLLTCDDELLVLHDVSGLFFSERVIPESGDGLVYEASHRAHVRWDWSSGWINNVHVDAYAQRLGFERGLTEAPCYIDYLFTPFLRWSGRDAFRLSIEMSVIRPIYVDDAIVVRLYRGGADDSYIGTLSRDGSRRVFARVSRT